MKMDSLPLPHRIMGYITLVLILLSQTLILYWAFWPYEPLKIEYIHKVSMENGKEFVYKMKYNKLMPLPADISKQFIDGFIVTMPATIANIGVGEFVTTHRIDIPKLPPGQYYFKWSGTYKVNPIREVTVTARTACFEVR
jgi:hypothetical protein